MTDNEFLAAFESGVIPPGEFHHQDHLRLTWLVLRRDGIAGGPTGLRAASGATPRATDRVPATTRP